MNINNTIFSLKTRAHASVDATSSKYQGASSKENRISSEAASLLLTTCYLLLQPEVA
jgi:hypothetical protein